MTAWQWAVRRAAAPMWPVRGCHARRGAAGVARPLLAAAAAAVACASQADRRVSGFQYGYVHVSGGVGEVDDVVEGLELRLARAGARVDVGWGVHVFAEGSVSAGAPLPGTEYDDALVAAGAGFHFPVSRRTDVVFDVAALRTRIDVSEVWTVSRGNQVASRFGIEESGIGGWAGIRTWLGSGFEGSAGFRRVSWDGGGAETSVLLGARYGFARRWTVTGDVSVSGDRTGLEVGIRYGFD